MPYTLFQGGRRRRRRPWRALPALVLLLAAAGALVLVARGDLDLSLHVGGGAGSGKGASAITPLTAEGPEPLAGGGTAPTPLGVRLDSTRDAVRVNFKHPPRAGLLFDLDTGRVLWRRNPTKPLPIASLTKMMTALVVTDRVRPRTRVRITKQALNYRGSGMGVLRLGRRVTVKSLLYGLLLPSGNDAARALAAHTGGTIRGFVALMNRRAEQLGLSCTHYTSPDGYKDRGNHSCAVDLAALARADLRQPLIADIARHRQAVLPFPIKGGRIYLYNHNPLLRQGYRGTTGLKTGYTDAAGRCLVATVRRGRVRLGAVLLHSPDPGKQAMQLFDRGFRVSKE
ncbi:MAG TPA: D-alanyl-D-alanine carboxypeptidase family protein [Solirubrobacteraceae bacterium]|jgi:D-alanyl-D-alanine carboxypeptidase